MIRFAFRNNTISSASSIYGTMQIFPRVTCSIGWLGFPSTISTRSSLPLYRLTISSSNILR